MQIAPLNINFPQIRTNFTSKVTRVIQGKLSQKKQDEIDKFEEEEGINHKKLGSGTQAVAYLLNDGKSVIKAAKYPFSDDKDGYFIDEARALSKIPSNLETCQRPIGYCKTEKGNFYLITTYAKGNIPDGIETKWNRKNLSSLLNTLANLDVANIYHGDVSKCNCLIDDNNEVNLIDFQYSEEFETEGKENEEINGRKYKVPNFLAPSNAQMFEESNFGTYLSSLENNEAQELFKEYLEEKSNYHNTRAKNFKKRGLDKKFVEYETLLAKYLKNPDNETIKIQAMKMQILLNHRYVMTAEDIGKQEDLLNILSTIRYYLDTIKQSNDMSHYINDLIEKESNPEKKKFLEYEKQYADFWKNIMVNELDGEKENSGVYNWISRNAAKKPKNAKDDISETFFKTANLEHKEIPNIYSKLTGENTNKNQSSTRIETRSILQSLNSFEPISKESQIETLKDSAEKNIKLSKESTQDPNETVFLVLNALYDISSAREIAKENSHNVNNDGKTRKQMKANRIYLERLSGKTESLSREVYERALNEAIK